MIKNESVKNGVIFDSGDANTQFSQYFIGTSYLNTLVSENEIVNVSNVTFEPACRNNWHIHHDGYQILLVTGGEGWYQETGKPAQHLTTGDVIVTHAEIKHWHGATKDSWFEHIAITTGTPEWLEPVSNDDYEQLSN